jgi:hypothetical protein
MKKWDTAALLFPNDMVTTTRFTGGFLVIWSGLFGTLHPRTYLKTPIAVID